MAIWEPAGSTPFDEERLRRMAESALVGTFETDARGAIVYASPQWAALMGPSATQSLPCGWIALVDDGDRARVETAWHDAVEAAATLDATYRFERDGELLLLRTALAPVRGPGGAPLRFAGATVDLTGFFRACTPNFPERPEQFREVAEAMPQLVWAAQADGTIEYFNRPWLDYTGVSTDDMRRSGVKNVVHPEDRRTTIDRWESALSSGEPYEIEYRLRRAADGTYHWFIGRAEPIRDASGTIVRWIGTATDIDAQQRANANLRFVLEASAALSATYEVDTICARLAELATNGVADWCFIVLTNPDGTYRTAALAHRDAALLDYVAQFRDRYPVRAGSPLDVAIRTNTARVIPSIGAGDLNSAAEDEAHLRLLERLQFHSAMLVPIASENGVVYGGITLVSAESVKTFTPEDLEVAQMVARRAAAAIQTAKAFEEERRRVERLHFIARASELVFESFDLQHTFDQVADFIVSEMGDLAYIVLVEDGSALRTVACAHRDSAKAAIAARLRGERTLRPEAEESAIRMLAMHRPFVHAHVTDKDVLPHMWDYLGPDVRALGVHSAITVPLFAHGDTLGALVAYWCDTPNEYTDADLPMFADLGRRLSIAIEHVRALERERRIAEALQQALLPSTEMLAQHPDLIVNADYRPSSREAEVGGDWYDAAALPNGSIVLSVGDVTGHGLDAAGLMGKMRQAIAMASMYEPDPARILDAVDFHLRTRRSDALVTAFVGIVDPERRTMRYANAGHPPPLLRKADEIVELRSSGLPLGLRDVVPREESREVSLQDAQLLALYTDGLIEGTRDIAFGERRLAQIVASDAILSVRNPARFLCDACLPFAAQDDTAVLTLLFGKRTHWTFDAENAEAAQEVRSDFVAVLRERSRNGTDYHAAELVFGELVGNVVRHAPGPIDVQLDWHGEHPVLHVVDRGKGFIRDPALPVDPLSESGRGLYIIAQLTHELRIERIPGYGNHVAAALRL